MKLELNDTELKLLLETLGKCHVIAHWKKDALEENDLGNLLNTLITQSMRQSKGEIISKVFEECPGPK
jgi:hypothetical protein